MVALVKKPRNVGSLAWRMRKIEITEPTDSLPRRPIVQRRTPTDETTELDADFFFVQPVVAEQLRVIEDQKITGKKETLEFTWVVKMDCWSKEYTHHTNRGTPTMRRRWR